MSCFLSAYTQQRHNRNKVKGNPTLDAKWNKCANNARRKYRDRYEDQTLTCVHRWNNDLGGTEFNPYGPWRYSIKRQFNLDEFTVEMAEAFDEICDEAEEIKAGGLPDPFRVSWHKLNQAYAHHYVVLTGDDFKGTGEQLTNCNEFGNIVAEKRVERGKKPWDNTPDPVHDIIGAKKEFKFKAPRKQVFLEPPDTGGASGSGGTGDAPESPPPHDDSHI